MADTTLLTGGRIHSPSSPDATAVAITDGTVVWVGQDGPGRALHPDAEEVPLAGAFVAPGFVDAHVHATATGLHLTGLDLTTCRSAADLLDRVRAAADELEPGAVLLAHGWDESTWSAGRPPSRTELDAAAGPVRAYLSRIDAHSALVSSALVDLGCARELPGWSADGPVTADAHHELRSIARAAITERQRAGAQRAFLAAAAARGIVAVHECAGPQISGADDLAALLGTVGDSTPDVVGYWGELASGESVAFAKRLGLAGLAGDLFVDGALGSHTAALGAPYSDAPERTGRRYLDADQIAAHLVACTEAGLQAGFHVIGDAALAEVIAGFERAEAAVGRRALVVGKHRIEHLEMVDQVQAKQLVSLNATASVQPLFDALWGGPDGMYAQRLGQQRAQAMNPFSMLAAEGVVLAAGSDAPVTPLDPWASVRAAVHHRTDGSGISPRAAFTAHTKGGYRAAGINDGVSGTLVPGAPANYAVWETDGLEVAAPDARVQRWSTDPRSRVPALPSVAPNVALPRCLRTVRRGFTLFDAGVLA